MAQAGIGNIHLLNFQKGNLIQPLLDLGLEKNKRYTEPEAFSVYTAQQQYVTPWISLCNALWEEIFPEPDMLARGQTANHICVSEKQSRSRTENLVITTYDKNKSGKIRAVAYDRNSSRYKKVVIDPEYAQKDTTKNFHTSATYILAAIMDVIFDNEEVAASKQSLIDAVNAGEKDKAIAALLRISDNVYRRVISLGPNDPAYIPLEDVGNGKSIPQLSQDSVESMIVKTIKGKFIKVGESANAASVVTINYAEYDLGIKHPDNLPVVNKQMDGWSPTEIGKTILYYYKESQNDPHGRINNFLLEGGNGTGKTALTKNDVAFALKCTWFREQLHGGICAEDICGTFYPVANDEASPDVKTFLESMPNEVEAQLNPAAAYKKATGKEKADATPAQVLAVINAKYQKFILDNKAPTNGVKLTFVPSVTLLANECAQKYGCSVLCLDEITRAPQEVLSVYNGFLEGNDGGMQTPQGWVKRSPNLIVIGTANPPETNIYCKKMDESLRQRFQKFFAVDVPSVDDMTNLILQYEYIKDPAQAEQMAIVISEIAQCMTANSIIGAVSIRNLVEWARDVKYGIDIKTALMRNVIQSVTSDKKEQQIIIDDLHANTSIYAG